MASKFDGIQRIMKNVADIRDDEIAHQRKRLNYPEYGLASVTIDDDMYLCVQKQRVTISELDALHAWAHDMLDGKEKCNGA